MNRTVEERMEASRTKMKEHIRKDLDELNRTIELLNEDKDKLQLDDSTLRMKLNAMTQ